MDVDGAAVTPAAGRPALRHAALPEWMDRSVARAIDKAVRDRLPAGPGKAAWYDPVTKARSLPGEERDAFAARLAAGGGGAKVDALRDKIDKKKRDLASREQDLS